MKKYILGVLAIILFIPVLSLAQSNCVDLKYNLTYGSRDAKTNNEVSLLQSFLKTERFLNSSSTGFFGSATLEAVKSFQAAYGISTTGYVGSLTRAKIKAMTCDSDVATTTASSTISLLSPNGGESWEVGKTYSISWNWKYVEQGAPLGIYLSASDEFGGTYIAYTIATNLLTSASATSRVYNWTIPSEIRPGKYSIRIVAYPEDKTKSFEDSSDSQFDITSNVSTATINSFNASAYTVNSGETISFSWTGSSVKEYKLYFGPDYGIGITMNSQSVGAQRISMGLGTSASATFLNTSSASQKAILLLEAYGSYSSSDSKKQIDIVVNPSTTTTTTTEANCSSNTFGSLVSGSSVTAYQSSSVASGSVCASETRTCSNGTLSGSYENASCSVASSTTTTVTTADCSSSTLGTITSGSSVTAYQYANVSSGMTCASETRTCSNGTLSGSYAYTSCSVGLSIWPYEWKRDLGIGSSFSGDITALQIALTKEGVYFGEVTGKFYTQTYLAVKAFQKKYGIESTGFVGLFTRAKLNELY